MTITVGDRVKSAIDEANSGRFEMALEHAAIAIDVTAKRYFAADESKAKNYKNLLIEYLWLIELLAFPGLNLEESKFGNYPIKKTPVPTFQDLIYDVIRCGLVHAEGVPDSFAFNDSGTLEFADERLVFPKGLIWALLALIVCCPCNSNEKTAEGYHLTFFGNKLVINDLWGQESFLRVIYERHKTIRVSVVIGENRPLGQDGIKVRYQK